LLISDPDSSEGPKKAAHYSQRLFEVKSHTHGLSVWNNT